MRFADMPWWTCLLAVIMAPIMFLIALPLMVTLAIVAALSIPVTLVYPDKVSPGEDALPIRVQRSLSRWRPYYARLGFWTRVARAGKVWRRMSPSAWRRRRPTAAA
jgi:hypothetical protein